MRFLGILSLVWTAQFTCAQDITCGGATAFEILHFTKTNGFDHNTRSQSAQMFTDIGALENFTITDTQDPSVFDDLSALLDYEVVVFSNTSGNDVDNNGNPDTLLNAVQKLNLEEYIDRGGAFLGIHAATDTYRTGWPFYNSLVGGIVQSNPNHTPNNYQGTMDVTDSHPSTDSVPDPWDKREEYYYWERNGGMLDSNIVETLRVRSTGDESYDEPRPMAWYQEFDSGARSYYTALGHNRRDYNDEDADFRKLIREALCWCVEAEAIILPVELISFTAEQDNCSANLLSWEINDYSNFSHFVVERSRDDVHYRSIYSTLNSSILRNNKSFSFKDESTLEGVQYYRLKMIDLDGSFVYSSVIAATNNCIQDGNMLIYPNPVSRGEKLKAKLYLSDSTRGLSIYDKNGSLVRFIEVQQQNGEVELNLDISGLLPNVYFLHDYSSSRVTRFVVVD